MKPAHQETRANPELISRAEFHTELAATRDRIGASYLALADKLDANQRDLLFALEPQAANFEHRLDQLESNFARLDERTRPVGPVPPPRRIVGPVPRPGEF